MPPTDDDRLFDCLAQWEASLDAGAELSVDQLAAGDEELSAQLRRWMEPLRATHWVRSVVTDPELGNVAHSQTADETADPRIRDTKVIHRVNPLAGEDVPLDEFLLRLAASGVLPADRRQAIESETTCSSGAALAANLVESGLLTPFQAESLLQGDFTRLVLGNYVLLRPLGSGGMGDVFLARHRIMDRLVALKMLPSSARRYPAAVQRFEQEIKALACLSHPNIVIAHDAANDRGTHFFVMEYVSGEDLAAVVQRCGPLPWPMAVECCRQAAEGLAYAHARGILHRDVKPSNLMLAHSRDQWSRDPQSRDLSLPQSRDQWSRLREGEAPAEPSPPHPLSPSPPPSLPESRTPSPASPAPSLKILDLGLSRAVEVLTAGQDKLTRTNAIIGTADFMAPEQSFDSAHVDHRADIYALGCTLYYLLTGRPVFPGETVGEKLLAHRNDEPDLSGPGFQPADRGAGFQPASTNDLRKTEPPAEPSPSLPLAPSPPPALASFLRSLLAKSPADRPQSMTAVATSLAALLRGEGVSPAEHSRDHWSRLREGETWEGEAPAEPSDGRQPPEPSAPHLHSAIRNPKSALPPSVSPSPTLPLSPSRRFSRRRLLTAALATTAASAAGFGVWALAAINRGPKELAAIPPPPGYKPWGDELLTWNCMVPIGDKTMQYAGALYLLATNDAPEVCGWNTLVQPRSGERVFSETFSEPIQNINKEFAINHRIDKMGTLSLEGLSTLDFETKRVAVQGSASAFATKLGNFSGTAQVLEVMAFQILLEQFDTRSIGFASVHEAANIACQRRTDSFQKQIAWAESHQPERLDAAQQSAQEVRRVADTLDRATLIEVHCRVKDASERLCGGRQRGHSWASTRNYFRDHPRTTAQIRIEMLKCLDAIKAIKAIEESDTDL